MFRNIVLSAAVMLAMALTQPAEAGGRSNCNPCDYVHQPYVQYRAPVIHRVARPIYRPRTAYIAPRAVAQERECYFGVTLQARQRNSARFWIFTDGGRGYSSERILRRGYNRVLVSCSIAQNVAELGICDLDLQRELAEARARGLNPRGESMQRFLAGKSLPIINARASRGGELNPRGPIRFWHTMS
ncbi:MAG: hypothetical protein JWO43_633 [Candidatus Adlerbacteria bacterium]|nr:hypothetical protein [Candidatus Adlerbacteria bacterium]